MCGCFAAGDAHSVLVSTLPLSRVELQLVLHRRHDQSMLLRLLRACRLHPELCLHEGSKSAVLAY